jgi:hypothetical protein
MVVVDYKAGPPWWLKLSPTGTLVLARDLSRVLPRAKIYVMTPGREGHFVLLGTVDGDALVIKGDEAGDFPWHKTFDRGATEFFVAGARSDSGFVLLGKSGRAGEEPRLWLMTLDDQGNIAAESPLFNGRHGSIARTSSGVLALVYDRGHSPAQEIRLVTLNDRLLAIAEVGILTLPRGMGTFHVEPAASGDLLVVGSADLRLWIARVTVDGKIRWSSTISHTIAARFGLSTDNHHALIPWTAIEVKGKQGEGKEIRSRIGVLGINTK